jgi:hypothetical protein
MSSDVNRQIVLAARPDGAPKDSDFRMQDGKIQRPGEDEVLCRTIYLSLDPYMRGRMSDAKSYARPVEVGDVMTAGAVSEVVSSNVAEFAPGTFVVGQTGWQEYAVAKGKHLRIVDPVVAPISTALGVLGMPGMTAYTGLLNIGQPKAGETVVVAAASGAVGSVVGQIAKLKGARAVGIAGDRRKCEFVEHVLGFDACVNRYDPDFPKALAAACPDGIDVYFENVGGAVLSVVLPLLNRFARVPVCGLISQYNMSKLPDGQDNLPLLLRATLSNRLTFRGFIVWDFADQEPEFLGTMGQWVHEGTIKYREDIVDGLENAPAAFMGLLEGKNFGKQLIRLAPDPTR